MANIEELEEFDKNLKSIFLHYMRDPKVIGSIKNIVNTENIITNSVEKTDVNSIRQVNNNSEELINKIDKLLDGQQRIESLIERVSQNNGNENKIEDDFESVKVEYESKISKLESENESKISECQNLKQLLEKFENENSELKSKNEKLELQIEALEMDKSQLIIQRDSVLQEKEKIQSDYAYLKRQYSEFDEPFKIWNSIQSLNDENKEYLEELCGSISAMSILSLGRDEGKVDHLWSYLKDLVVEGKQAEEQIEILSEYFEFCINISNACKYNEEKYCILDIKPGDEFDMDKCIRSADSKQIGNVSRIIVKGVKEGEKVLFKAIVSVE